MSPKNPTPAPPANPATVESEGWRPEDGDVLTGTVNAVSKAWSEWTNSFYPLVTIDTGDKLVDVHAFHDVLRSRLMETQPKVGDKLEIAYLGKRPTKDGKREVAVYKVTVPGETGEAVWADLNGQSRRNAAAAVTGDVPADETDLPGSDQPQLGSDEDIPF